MPIDGEAHGTTATRVSPPWEGPAVSQDGMRPVLGKHGRGEIRPREGEHHDEYVVR